MTQWSVVAASTSELAEKFGAAGLRVAHYTKDEKELWLLRRYLFTLAANQLLPFPVRVIRSERPDFIISFGGKAPAALEITEGTHSSDARERSLARKIGGIHLIGQHGGRGSGGFEGDKPERLWCADVIRAMRRKLRKPYAKGNFTLLVYTNSNPALVVHASCAAKMLRAKLDGRAISGIELSGIHTSMISGDCLIYNATIDPQHFPLVKKWSSVTDDACVSRRPQEANAGLLLSSLCSSSAFITIGRISAHMCPIGQAEDVH